MNLSGRLRRPALLIGESLAKPKTYLFARASPISRGGGTASAVTERLRKNAPDEKGEKNEKNNKKMTLFDGNQCLNKYTGTFYVDL